MDPHSSTPFMSSRQLIALGLAGTVAILALPADRARQLIANEFEDVTDDEMKLIDAKYDEHAKALQAKVWSLAEAK